MESKLRDALQCVQQEADKLLAVLPVDNMTLHGGLSIIRERARAALALPNPSAYMRRLYDSAYELRRAQKTYFRTRAQTELTRCRVLESKFDELLDEVALNSCGELRFRPVQPTLFCPIQKPTETRPKTDRDPSKNRPRPVQKPLVNF